MDENNWIKERIEHFLNIYPGINRSMLQLCLTLPAAQWKPILQDMISQEIITTDSVVKQSPGGRSQTYERLFLKG